jgi:hypothetical protein
VTEGFGSSGQTFCNLWAKGKPPTYKKNIRRKKKSILCRRKATIGGTTTDVIVDSDYVRVLRALGAKWNRKRDATDRFRSPYGRRLIESPRQCVFVGTVNHSEYLRDENGGDVFGR